MFLVLIGPAVSVQMPLAGSARAIVNVSLYEIVMLPVTAMTLSALPRLTMPWPRLALFIVPAVLVMLHSLYAAAVFPDLAHGDLFKETVKYVAFFVFTVSLSIYLSLYIEPLAFRRILTLAFVAVLVWIVISWARYAIAGQGPVWGSLSPYAALVLLYLYVATGEGPKRDAPETWALPIVAVAVIALWGAKLFTGLALGVALWGLLARRKTRDPEIRRKSLVVLFGTLLLCAVALAVWWGQAAPYGRSLSRSIGERIDLWALAWELFQIHFPWGIGLGQFAGAAAATNDVVDLYPHNTLVSALVELGLLGLVFMGLLLAIVLVSIGTGPYLHLWIALLIAIGPMLLHDVLSFRSLQILLAVGLAGLLSHDDARPNRLRGL